MDQKHVIIFLSLYICCH